MFRAGGPKSTFSSQTHAVRVFSSKPFHSCALTVTISLWGCSVQWPTWRTAQSQNIGGVVNIILYLFYVGCGYVRPFSEAIYDHCISQHQFTSSVKAIQDSLLDLCLLEMSAWWQSPRAVTWMIVLWSLRFNTALTSWRSSIEGTEFNSNNNDMYAHSPREPKKAVKSKPSYSSSGKSSKPSRRFF